MWLICKVTMNLIRLIKLKKWNGELDDLPDAHKFFIAQFDELKQKSYSYLSLKINEQVLVHSFYYKNAIKIFEYNPRSEIMYCSRFFINILINNFNFNDDSSATSIIKDTMNNYLNIRCVEVIIFHNF